MRKLNLKKIIAMGLITTSILAVAPAGASAEWRQSNNGWWYAEGNSYSRGWKNIGGSWYYFDNNGYMKEGWINDGDNWYYLKTDGTMATGTINIDGQLSHFYGDGRWQGYVTNNTNNQSTTTYNNNSQATTATQGGLTYSEANDLVIKHYKQQLDNGEFEGVGTESVDPYTDTNGKQYYLFTRWLNDGSLAIGQCNLLGVTKVYKDGTIKEETTEWYMNNNSLQGNARQYVKYGQKVVKTQQQIDDEYYQNTFKNNGNH
ncbi:hypothetical protein [Clostridium butyricum]